MCDGRKHRRAAEGNTPYQSGHRSRSLAAEALVTYVRVKGHRLVIVIYNLCMSL